MDLTIAHKKFIENLKRKNRAHSTIIAYSKDIQQLIEYLRKKESITEIKDVKSTHLNRFMEGLRKQGYTLKSISRKTNSTKTFFKFLKEELNIIENNPANMVSHPKLTPKAPRILSKIEYKALRDAVKKDIRTYAIVEILLQTGIRISELAEIRLQHIKMSEENKGDKGTLYIPKRGSNEERTIPLNKSVQQAIREYLKIRPFSKKDYLLVTKTGNQLLVRNIRSTLDKYFKEIGLENVKVNDLRHTFIAQHLERGTPIYIVSKVAGHKRLSTTEKYLEYIKATNKDTQFELEEL